MGQAGTIARALGLRPWADRAALVAYQEERLRAAVRHAYASVPYYRELLDRHGVRPADVRGRADLARLPISAKDDLRHQPPERVLAAGVDRRRLQRIQTTGSTGEPFVLYRARPEKWLHQLFWLRAQRAAGHRLGERVVRIAAMHSRPAAKREPVGDLLRRLGVRNHVLDVSAPPAELLGELAALRPGIVGSYPGMLARLGEELERSGRDDIRPRLLATGGEVLTPARRRQIEATWRAPVREVYGCWEMNLVAWSCPAAGGFHVCDDSVVLEVVRDGREVEPGERGEVVLTSLHATAMPLIRYRLGDIATRGGPDGCACGQPFATIASVQGRMLDLFRLPGGRLLHPYEILADLKEDAFRWVRQYQLVQEAEDRVVFRMVRAPGFRRERLEEFERRAARALGPGAVLRTEIVERIEPGPGGKFHLARSLVATGEDAAAWHGAAAAPP